MEKTIIYRRNGKFGYEFFIALENLRIIQCKETEKAYACGSFNTAKQYIDGWIAKSLCKEIEGKIYCPTWVLKWTDLTRRILNDYCHEEFDVREFPAEDSGEKEPVPEYCFTVYPDNGNAEFGSTYRKGCKIENKKKIGKDENTFMVFLISCYDKYEDGYCVFACKADYIDDSSSEKGKRFSYKIIGEVQFRGNCEYPSKYVNKFAGERTFEKIEKLEDFELLKSDCYSLM